MPVDIGATGFIGIARETTPGTALAPTKFFPINSENLEYVQNTIWRKQIRGTADVIGAVNGYSHVEGTISMELLDDVLPYFLYASRNVIVKSGAGPIVYTCTPSHGAGLGVSATVLNKTLSITVVRDGQTQVFAGCQMGDLTIKVDASGIATMDIQIMGLTEATATLPTASFLATSTPYGPGTYNIQIPTATQILDADIFNFTLNENLVPEYRLNTTRSVAYYRYGDRAVTLGIERDFQDRTQLDNFKALTSESVTVLCTKGANNSVAIKLAASIKDKYNINGLQGEGTLIRASVDYTGTFDATTSKAYEIIVTTSEVLT